MVVEAIEADRLQTSGIVAPKCAHYTVTPPSANITLLPGWIIEIYFTVPACASVTISV